MAGSEQSLIKAGANWLYLINPSPERNPMPRGFFETTAYLKTSDLTRVAGAIEQLLAQEGMQRLALPEGPLSQAPALENNRWALALYPGAAGWSVMLSLPWDLLAERADEAGAMRFVSLCDSLGIPGCLVSVHDGHPWGEVIVEADGQGMHRLSGWWLDESRPQNQFYGEPLGSDGQRHRFELLPELQGILDACPSDDQGRHDIEQFCRDLASRLGGEHAAFTSEWSRGRWADLSQSGHLPIPGGQLLHFVWPANDRPEPSAYAQALAELELRDHYFYADGAPVRAGDEVALTDELKPARVVGVVTVNDAEGMPQVSGVLIEQGEEQWVIWGEAVSESLHLLSRETRP